MPFYLIGWSLPLGIQDSSSGRKWPRTHYLATATVLRGRDSFWHSQAPGHDNRPPAAPRGEGRECQLFPGETPVPGKTSCLCVAWGSPRLLRGFERKALTFPAPLHTTSLLYLKLKAKAPKQHV